MNRKKIFKLTAILALAGIIIGGLSALYMFNMPHRDIQSTDADYKVSASALVSEFLSDIDAANAKYLSADGDSKILVVTGTVFNLTKDMNNQIVVVLKSGSDKAGVSATFMESTNKNAEKLTVGDQVSIKGVIRSGAAYDEDLEFYEDVILEKSDIIQ